MFYQVVHLVDSIPIELRYARFGQGGELKKSTPCMIGVVTTILGNAQVSLFKQLLDLALPVLLEIDYTRFDFSLQVFLEVVKNVERVDCKKMVYIA